MRESVGYKAGDVVLKEVARRLQQGVRDTDTAARLGGDELVLLLISTKDSQAAGMIAKKVLEALAEPIVLNNKLTHTIGARISIAIYPKDGGTLNVLLSNADSAMYVARQDGKNNYRFCS